MRNRSLPADTLLPHIRYVHLAEAADWLKSRFGFKEAYRHGDPLSGVMLHLGAAYLMLHRAGQSARTPAELGFGTQMLTVLVDDVNAHYANTLAAGAVIVEQLHETVYGERQYGVEDLEGHRWLFSQHVRDSDPAEWGAVVNQED